jgi:putative lipoic acid-binding regulatory protein
MESISSELHFPQSFNLKVIFESVIPESQRVNSLMQVLEKNMVPYDDFTFKESSKKKYISYSIRILLISYDQMQDLYRDLKEVEGIKLAM